MTAQKKAPKVFEYEISDIRLPFESDIYWSSSYLQDVPN